MRREQRELAWVLFMAASLTGPNFNGAKSAAKKADEAMKELDERYPLYCVCGGKDPHCQECHP